MHLRPVCCIREQPQPQALEEKLLTLLGHPQETHLLKRRAAACQTHIRGGRDFQNQCLENAKPGTNNLFCGLSQGATRCLVSPSFGSPSAKSRALCPTVPKAGSTSGLLGYMSWQRVFLPWVNLMRLMRIPVWAPTDLISQEFLWYTNTVIAVTPLSTLGLKDNF